jgi:hypothetical protein
LDIEYNEIRKILGNDVSAYLIELGNKKARIKGMCQQKIDSYKKK